MMVSWLLQPIIVVLYGIVIPITGELAVVLKTLNKGTTNDSILFSRNQYIQLSKNGFNVTEVRNVTFYLKACHDAVLALWNESDISSDSDDYYEIVFEAGNNSLIQIRYGKQMSNVAIGNSKYLDCYNFKEFSLDLTNGDLWYGTTKLFSAFALHFHKITLSTREIGIMTRNGCDGEWIFIGGQNTSSHCDNRRQYLTPNVTTTIQQLVQDIRIQDKTVLSTYKRKKICADDSRVTCVSLGCIGSVVIILIGIFIVILDLLPKRVQSE